MARNQVVACGVKGTVNQISKLWNQFSNDGQIRKNMPEENMEEAFIHLIESELNMTLEDINHFDVVRVE